MPLAAAKLKGVKRVLRIACTANQPPLAAVLAPQIAKLAGQLHHVLAPSTTFGKDCITQSRSPPGSPQVSDVMAVWIPTVRRPIYAGNAIATVEVDPRALRRRHGPHRIVPPAAKAGPRGDGPAVDAALPSHSRYVDLKQEPTGRTCSPPTRVVSGGRGVGSKENFTVIYKLADKLGAAVGASRAAVDAGFVPNDLQVGQTGKIIAPDLYIAVGISGAIQHITGIKDARTIVAINRTGAPIFQVADLGLVGDLFQLLPELEKLLG